MKLLQHDKSNNSALSARHSYLLNNVHSDQLRVIITGGILGVHFVTQVSYEYYIADRGIVNKVTLSPDV